MRRYWAPLAVVCLALAGHGLWGQTPYGQTPPPPLANPFPAATVVVVSQADVYSGPAATFYPTSRVVSGDRVVVLGESKKAPGWLEIVPPPRSFSWIDAKYVKTVAGMDKIGIVDVGGDPNGQAPVLPGSIVANKEPNVEITKVKTGTQVFLLDRPSAVGAATMYPISPVATEVRFIQASAVQNAGGGGVYAGGYGNYSGTTIPTGWQAPNAPVGPADPYPYVKLSQLGDQALAGGNASRAKLYYVEALGQANDPRWRDYLTGKLTQLSGQPTTPVNTGSSPAPWGTPNPNGTAPLAPAGPTGPAALGPKQWSKWGYLKKTAIASRDGLPIYVLETREGAPLTYVSPGSGGTLTGYEGTMIAVYGALATRSDEYVQMQYLIAEQVATPPTGQPGGR